MDIKQSEGAMRRKLFGKLIKSVTDNRVAKVMCVVFADGGKEIVRCSPSDDYDPEIGFALACARHMLGSRTQVRKYLEEASRVIQTADPEAKPRKSAANRSVSLVEYGWFRDWMEQHKVSTVDVAKLCGVATSTVSRLRCGCRVASGTLAKVREALGLSDEEFRLLEASLTRKQPRYRK